MTTSFLPLHSTLDDKSKRTPKKTNSLGWAALDCHTCQSSTRVCDRRRPRCDVCTGSGVSCGGYAQKLEWMRGIASRGKMSGKSYTASGEKMRFMRKEKGQAERSKLTNFTFVQESGKDKSDATTSRQRFRSRAKRSIDITRRTSSSSEGFGLVMSRSIPNFFHFTPQVTEILNFYQWNFSFVFLTFDVHVNPWKMCLPIAFETPCLLDAIIALGKRHRAQLSNEVEDVDVLVLKDRALRSFRSTLETTSPAALIATILVLMVLDYARSGYSNWTVHLQGAHHIIEYSGGISIAQFDSSLQSQLAMLAWWDVTGSLISRRAPNFPRQYIEAVLSWRRHSEWSLLALNGYPDALFELMYDIAMASATVKRCGNVSLDHEVENFERRLRDAQFETKDKHLTSLLECWRQGLLLYCARVFGPCTPTLRVSIAKEIFHLINNIPPNSHSQKQCLLPAILAACEFSSHHQDVFYREVAEDYLSRWNVRCGLRFFNTALLLVRRTWEGMDREETGDDGSIWWGDVVTKLSRSVSGVCSDWENTFRQEMLLPHGEWLFG